MPAESLLMHLPSSVPMYSHMNNDSSAGGKSLQGVLEPHLKEILKNVHPNLVIRSEALSFVESRLAHVLDLLSEQQPHTISEVDDRIRLVFPNGLIPRSISYAREKKQLIIPVTKLHPVIQKEYLPKVLPKDCKAVSTYLCAILQFLASEILRAAGKYIIHIRHSEITEQDVKVSVSIDEEILELFFHDSLVPTSDYDSLSSSSSSSLKGPMNYEDILKEFITDEKTFLRELRIIKKVFRPILERICPAPVAGNGVSADEMQAIFGPIDDLHANIFTSNSSMNLVDGLEDAMEMDNQGGGAGWVGVRSVFEEITEGEEFEAFAHYADAVLPGLPFDTLSTVLSRPFVEKYLRQVVDAPGLLDAFRYVLPKLLMSPVYRISQYAEFLRVLRISSGNPEDVEVLQQAEDDVRRIVLESVNSQQRRCAHGKLWKQAMESHARIRNRINRNRPKASEIFKCIEGWDEKENSQRRLDFVLEGDLTKLSSRERRTDRHVFLFETCIVLCKTKQPKPVGGLPEYRYKEMMPLHRTYVINQEDSEEHKYAFELQPRDHDQASAHQILCASNLDEKILWLGSLIMLQTRGMLDRLLDKTTEDEDRANPLRLPMPEMYVFAQPDGPQNLVLEDGPPVTRGVPLIKGATLVKLVERLTYHQYADPAFVKTFLITFRTFTTASRVLDLLIERFKIPLPTENGELSGSEDHNPSVSAKRFKKEYCQPVQFRVLNVMRQWVDNHFPDFENDPELLQRLKGFLEEISEMAATMRKWAESIVNVLERKQKVRNAEFTREMVFRHPGPEIEWHLADPFKPKEFDLMTLHPKEIARQLTLIDAELFRAIKPADLMSWNSKEQSEDCLSNTIQQCIRFFDKISHYIVQYILVTENLEERVVVMSRVIDIMSEFEKLNNFSGLTAVNAVFAHAAVHRLKRTKELLASKYSTNAKLLEKLQDICPTNVPAQNFFATLRRINPPCVPLVGPYLTIIHFLQKGNPLYLAAEDDTNCRDMESRLINFGCLKKIAENIAEIQQYQNQPYCLTVEPSIHDFFLKLDPYEGDAKNIFEDKMWHQSVKIEPKDGSPTKFPGRFTQKQLRQPRPAHLSSTVRSPSLGSTFSINAQVTSPNNNSSTLQRIFEAGLGGGGGGDKSRTPSVPSTPQSPNAAYTAAVNAAHIDLSSINTPRFSITAPTDSAAPASPSGLTTPAQPLPPALPPRAPKLSNGGEHSPRDFIVPGSADSATSKFPFPFDDSSPTSAPPPVPERLNSMSGPGGGTLTPDSQLASPITPYTPATDHPSFFNAAAGDAGFCPQVLFSDGEDPAVPPPLPPRQRASAGHTNAPVPELPPKTRSFQHNLSSIHPPPLPRRESDGDLPGF